MNTDDERLDDLEASDADEVVGGGLPAPGIDMVDPGIATADPEAGIVQERDRYGVQAGPASAEARREDGGYEYEAGAGDGRASGRIEAGG